jgi:glycosyltransferase involved in cell wall biosynthesis
MQATSTQKDGERYNRGMDPKVTVILPVYNGEPYLSSAIKSVLDQTFADFELLIIDDFSYDRSREIIREYNDPRIRIVLHKFNLGLIITLQEGLQLARGMYIARIDADDAWTSKDKLIKQITFLDTYSEYNLIGTQARMVNEKDEELFLSHLPTSDREIRKRILRYNPFIHPSVLFRKQAAIVAGGFKNNEKYIEDYSLWLRLGDLGSFANLNEYLMSYRIHSGGESQKNNLEQIKNSLELIGKHKNTYQGFFLAYIKWNLKLLIITMVKPDIFLKVKKWIS